VTGPSIHHPDPVEHPPEWPVYTPDEVARCAELVRTGRTFDYGRGDEIERLETIFAQFYGRKNCLAVNSGTSALLGAYYALRIGAGDEVIVPSFTFASTATPLLVLGAVPVLCDSGCETGNVTAESIAAAITPHTRAVTVTHLWGHLCEMQPIRELCQAQGLALVEDCSHAHAASLKGTIAGSIGDVAIFSIGGHKMISGGLGGILLTDSDELFARACLLANFQKRAELSLRDTPFQDHAPLGLGGNLRISPMAAVLAHSQMERVAGLVATKRRNAERLLSGLAELPGLTPQVRASGADLGGWFGVNLRYDEDLTGLPLDHVMARLQASGLKVRRPHTRPLSHSALFSGSMPDSLSPALTAALHQRYGNRRHADIVAERLWRELIALPGNYLHEENSALPDEYIGRFRMVWADVVDAR